MYEPNPQEPRDVYAVKARPEPTTLQAALIQAITSVLNAPAPGQPWPEEDHWITVPAGGRDYAVQFDEDGAFVYAEDEDRIHTDVVLAFIPRPPADNPFATLEQIKILPNDYDPRD